MQMTPSPIKRDNADLNKLITWTLFLQTLEMKSSILILATQTQRQQWYKEFNTGCSLMVTN